MTIQLELNFLSSSAYVACYELRAFALTAIGVSSKQPYISSYKELQRQASDLTKYAFLNDYIDSDEYDYLADVIFNSVDIFWS